MNFAQFRNLLFTLVLALPALSYAAQGPVLHYVFNEGSGAAVSDSSGNGNTGTLLNGTAWTPGMLDGAAFFDGVNDSVRATQHPSLEPAGGITVAMIAYITDPRASGYSDLMHKDGTGTDGYLLRWSHNDARLQFRIARNGKPILVATNPSSNTTLINAWHHFVGTFDAATGVCCLYIDGTLRAQASGAVGAMTHTSDLYLMYTGEVPVPGKLDDVRVYDHALTAGEIAQLAQLRPGATSDSYTMQPGQTLNTAAPGVLANDIEINGEAMTAVKDSDPAHGALTLNSNGSFTYTPAVGFGGIDTFTYHANDGHGNDSPSATVTIDVTSLPAGLIAWYRFDEGVGTSARDSSGNAYTGSLVSGTMWTPGIINGGTHTDGVANYVSLPTTSALNFATNAPFTIAGWVRTTDSSGPIISFRSSTNGNTVIDLCVGFDGNSYPGRLLGNIRHDNTGAGMELIGNSMADGRWHMVALTRNAGSTVSMYLDGVLQEVETSAPAAGPLTSNLRAIGSERRWVADAFGAAGDRFLTADFDDFYIFNRELSQAELLALIPQFAPAAKNDAYPVAPGNTLNLAAPGVLANDTDFNLDTLTAIKDSDAAHGTASLNSDGSFSYIPQNGFSGVDSFTYHANDGHGNDSAVVTVTITVANIPAGLVLWYQFAEGSGTVANDSSGYGNHGTLVGGVPWISGINDSAILLNGSTQYVGIPALAFEGDSGFTLAGWVRTVDTFGALVSLRNTNDGDTIASAMLGKDGVSTDAGKLMGIVRENSGGTLAEFKGASINNGQWRHFAMTRNNGNTIQLFLDGIFQGTASGSGANGNITADADGSSIGCERFWYVTNTSPVVDCLTAGSFEDIRIYNRQLTSGEILGLVQRVPTTTMAAGPLTTSFKTSTSTVVLSATVAAASGPLSEGTVTFQIKNGATNVGTAATGNVAGGSCTVNYTLPAAAAVGNYTIEAKFNATVAFEASLDNSRSLTIQPSPTTATAANATAAFSASDQQAALNAAVLSPGGIVNEGTVTFQIKNGAVDVGSALAGSVANGAASVNYTIPAGTPLGNYTILVAYSGTNFTECSDNTHTLKIVEPNTMAAENASIPYKAASQNVTLRATITGAAGTVNEGTVTFQIKNGAVNVGAAVTSPPVSGGSASASYALPAGTPAGSYSIFSSYSGGPNFPPSIDNTKSLTITKAATGTSPTNTTTPYSFSDQFVALSIQVTSSAGVVNEGTVIVQLKSGAQNLGTAVTSSPITNGTASVSYTIPGGTSQGVYAIQAAYSGGANFAPSNDNAKTVTITKATPAITWPNPADIAYGTALGAAELNAGVGGIPGTFVYNPVSGSILAVGNAQPISVTFTPTDNVNYNSAQKSVAINVIKKNLNVSADSKSKLPGSPNPVLTASYDGFVNGESAAVLTGTPALSTTANAGSPPGNYIITVARGTLNAANYSFSFVNGTLTVSNQPVFFNLSSPNVPYATPTAALSGRISFGTTGAVNITLNGVSKSATIDASGFFTADLGTASLELGTYPVQFSYPGSGSIGAASDSSTLTVIKATPELTWSNPADIPFGTQLSAAQLNATANVGGTFAYNPPAGTVLAKGTHQLSTHFIPTDAAHYVSASANAALIVGLAVATITWETPADIVYGTALSDAQLNATADIAGAFTYTPPAGTIFNAGDSHKLSLTFTPDDLVNYATSHVDVFINVLKADQSITFEQIPDQEIGNPALTLSATASSNFPVTITLVSGNANLQGSTLTLLGLGAITLRAEQAGDANINAAPTVEQTFQVIIIPPHLTSALSASGTQGQAFTFTLTASGTRPVTFESGTLPQGLSLNGNSGEISGAPAGSGAFQFAVTARNAGGAETKTLTLVFASSGSGENHAPKFTSGVLATPNPASVNLEVAFNAAAGDEDGDSVAVVWDFGDGTQGFGAATTHRYTTSGIFAARVTITDGVASDYLNIAIVVNAAVIPSDQYKQYVVSKLGLKFNFAKPNLDSLSISGTIPIPPAFAPEGKVVKFESGGLQREWPLDKKATSADKAFKLTGKFAKDGSFTASPAKFALAIKNQDLFTGLTALGFVNDNTPKGMIVRTPVILILEGTGYLATIDVKYAAKKGKSGSGKK